MPSLLDDQHRRRLPHALACLWLVLGACSDEPTAPTGQPQGLPRVVTASQPRATATTPTRACTKRAACT